MKTKISRQAIFIYEKKVDPDMKAIVELLSKESH